MTLRRVAIAGALVTVAGLVGLYCLTQRAPEGYPRFETDEIDESSGLAASRRHPGVFWTHNDSGDVPRLFAVTADGRLRGEFSVEGAVLTDWEAITADLTGHLYIADSGNNDNERRDLVVYRVREPDLPLSGPPIRGRLQVDRRVEFSYPEQRAFPDPERENFDAEAVFWAPHPATGEGTLYLLTKHRSDTRTVLYRFDDLSGTRPIRLVRVGELDVGGAEHAFGGMVTGADATPGGQRLAVLTYHALFVFGRPERSDDYFTVPLARIDLDQSVTKQVEGVAWAGDGLLFSNEQGALFHIDAPLTRQFFP